MLQIIAALLYTFISISNALENKALPAETYESVGEGELKYVVSLGVFKDGIYIHICMAVMITGLNGITAGKCGHYDYYADEAGLIEREKNLPEDERTKLHVNTKRPINSDPDTFYTVIRFIHFDKYLFDQSKGERYLKGPDIGVIVLKKKVQFTRPVFNVPISTIKKMPYGTNLTLIGMYIIDEESSGDKLLIKKKIKKYNFYCQRYRDPNLKHSQFRVLSYYYSPERFLLKDDLGGPIYWENQPIGILVDNQNGIATIDAIYEKHIDEIIASTWFPQMKEYQPKRSAKASTSGATTT